MDNNKIEFKLEDLQKFLEDRNVQLEISTKYESPYHSNEITYISVMKTDEYKEMADLGSYFP